jgi:hypothetical protein
VRDVADNQTNEQCDCGDHLKVEECLAAHTADFFHVLHAGYARDHGAKDDQRNDHRDEPDETIAKRLHGDGFSGAQITEHHRSRNGDKDLHPEIRVERRFACALSGGH